MPNRWSILAVLFLARMTMSFQFQAVAALSPLLERDFGVTIADVGLLIGLYLAPGMLVAIPGGAIAARFGDKRVVALAMIAMLSGGLLTALGPAWSWLVAGRVLAGTGGVVINIVMTKMLMDWFVGREIATAMAIFINSWPVGIALALLTVPALAEAGGIGLAWAAVNAVILAGLILFALVYRPAAGAAGGDGRVRVARLPMRALFLAAAVWALYNAAFAIVFSFGPAYLAARGWDLTLAGSATSAFIVVVALAIPIGGLLADRTGRRDAIILLGFVADAGLLPLVLVAPDVAVLPVFVLAGVIFGLAAGPIVSLPARILQPENRAFGTGVYYTVYYAIMMGTPTLAGAVAEQAGSIGATFVLGAALSVAGILALVAFNRACATLVPPPPQGA